MKTKDNKINILTIILVPLIMVLYLIDFLISLGERK